MIMLNYILLATFLKHFISSLIRIKFERMQIYFFFVKFLLLLLSLYAFKKLPIDLTGWLMWLCSC